MTDPDRTVLRLSGAQVSDFLQNLVTNDVDRLKDGLVYAALLTPQGKYRADFFLVPDGTDILLDVAAPLAADLKKALMLYKLRADVAIAETDIVPARGAGAPPEGAFADPRDPALGWRAYDGRASEDGVDWTARRVAACIPESGIELTPDTFILEAGFERLSGVDFRKGCYVGQEVTARMKHKTELKKGLARVAIEGGAPVGTPVTAGDKTVGTLFSQADGHALAHLRFPQAAPEMRAGDAILRYEQP